MFRKVGFLLLFSIAGCIEPYEFVVKDSEPSLVVEGFLSDKSFNETLNYPSDGRYFTVKLTYTGDVTNTRPVPVTDAVVEVVTSDGQQIGYESVGDGLYELHDANFKALPGISYKLRIALRDENVYESSWETLPDTDVPAMGKVGFKEIDKQLYVMESGKWMLRSKQFVSAFVEVPENTSGSKIFYRWTYSPIWIYVAPLVSLSDPVSTCWATDPNYFNYYGLQIDNTGGYRKDLFEFPTIRNERIYKKFSVLVTQYAMGQDYYTFWREMKEQAEGSTIQDVPPFNLKTNFTCITAAKRVSGYFGVSAEQATRWYFEKRELSYEVTDMILADCLVVYGPGPPAEECLDCRAYSFGKATTTKPTWWQQ